MTKDIRKELERYKTLLTDLSNKNRTLRLLKLSPRNHFDLTRLAIIDKELPNKIVKSAIEHKKVSLIDMVPDDQKLFELSDSIKKIYQTGRIEEEEKGAYNLYVGYPFIYGQFLGEDHYYRCPLLLFPVRLEESSNKQQAYQLVPDDTRLILLNPSFFLAYQEHNQVKLDVAFLNSEEDKDQIPQKEPVKWALDKLKNLGIKINNPEDVSVLNLEQFTEHRKAELPTDKQGKNYVVQYAVLGYFPQTNSSLLADYEDFLKRKVEDAFKPILNDSIEKQEEKEEKTPKPELLIEEINVDKVPQQEFLNFFQTDESQEQAILAAREDRNIVIYGPPGTGKSQVISSIILDAVYHGKTVLVVSQKPTALNVVYKRIFELGLSDLIAFVHDPAKDKRELYNKIERLNNKYKDRDPNLDIKFEKLCKDIDDDTNKLNEYATALYAPTKFGLHAKELYEKSSKLQSIFKIEESCDLVNFDELDSLTKELNRIGDNYAKFNDPAFWISKRRSFSNTNQKDKVIIQNAAVSIKSNYEALEKILKNKAVSGAINSLDLGDLTNSLKNINWALNIYRSKNDGIISSILSSDYREAKAILNDLFINLDCNFNEYKDEIKLNVISVNNATSEEAKTVLSLLSNISHYINALKVISYYLNGELNKELGQNLYPLDKNAINNFIKDLSLYEDIYELDKSINELSENQQKLLGIVTQHFIPKRNKSKLKGEWISSITKSVLDAEIHKIEEVSPVLKMLSWDNYQKLGIDFADKLEQKKKLLPKILETKHATVLKNYSRELKHMDKTHRRHLRRFIEEYVQNHLFDILPCWLCTPEAVSTIFPPKHGLFDLVIFDEASQCRVEYALPSIYRGKKTVVAGDDKQLPPYDLFQINSTLDEYEEDDDDDVKIKSLLNLAQGTFDSVSLKWHYRSKYEELINFSNYSFYRGELQVSPNSTKNIKAIEYLNVKGNWVNRQNKEEAKKVVDLLYNLLKNDTKRTYGIITFNITQRDLIKQEIEDKKNASPDFKSLYNTQEDRYDDKENIGLFVKNIEMVQGDERDVIIFSVGYAPDENNRFVAQFGSLSKLGGEKRLNVAITRAKQKVYVVASIEPEEFKVAGTKNEGPKKLGEYLQYAKLISDGKFDEAKTELGTLIEGRLRTERKLEMIFESEFEETVCNDLEKMGYKVDSQVGCSKYRIDLAIISPKDKNKYVLGIECDGAAYHSSRSARDRDIYRQRFLEMRGWKIYRIKSRDWWNDKKKVLMDIKHEVMKAS